MWVSCKVCVQGKQEKTETDVIPGREAARSKSEAAVLTWVGEQEGGGQ